jgi:uncharacterized membrane protein
VKVESAITVIVLGERASTHPVARRSRRAIIAASKGGETMGPPRRHELPSIVMFVAGGLLFADLFLSWQEVSANRSYENGIANGWHGWGAFAGILLMVILLRGLVRAFGAPIGTFFDLVASGAVLVFVVARVRDVGATTHGLMTVQVGATRWPAWAGVVLAATFAACSLVVFVQHVLDHHRRHIGAIHAAPQM